MQLEWHTGLQNQGVKSREFESLHLCQLKGLINLKKTITSEEQRAIDEWLKHNKPTTCPSMQRSDPNTINKKYGWGSKKKKNDT